MKPKTLGQAFLLHQAASILNNTQAFIEQQSILARSKPRLLSSFQIFWQIDACPSQFLTCDFLLNSVFLFQCFISVTKNLPSAGSRSLPASANVSGAHLSDFEGKTINLHCEIMGELEPPPAPGPNVIRVVVVGNAGETNQMLINYVNGSFTQVDLPGGEKNTFSIATGDVDGDADIDLIVGNDGQANQVLFNDGNLNFLPVDLPGGSRVTEVIAMGDLDGDNDLDVVVGNYNQPNQVLLNRGNGTFTSHDITTSYADETWGIALGDVDNDGDMDIVFGNNGQLNKLLLNDGTGTFSTSNLPGNPPTTHTIAMGDVNGDSFIDVVIGSNCIYNHNQLLVNHGNGTFRISTLPGNTIEHTFDIKVFDIDGDDDMDIVFGNFNGGNELLLNDGKGNFTLKQLPGNTVTRSIAFGDVDGDSDIDIIVGNWRQSNQILLNNGNETFTVFDLPGGNLSQTTSVSFFETSLPASQPSNNQTLSPLFDSHTTTTLACKASTNAPEGGTLSTRLTAGPCFSENSAGTGGAESFVVLDGGSSCKNSGTCTWTHCFRADYWYQGINVLAAMQEVVSTVTFDLEGSFTASVDTASFEATSATSSSSRSESINAQLGSCDNILSRQESQVEIGATVEICVYSNESDLSLSLRNVFANPGNQTLVNSAGVPNFVTSLTNDNSNMVTLGTLMIPAYYDSQIGKAGVIVFTGTAVIAYSDRRILFEEEMVEAESVEEVPFNLEVGLAFNKDYSVVVQHSSDQASPERSCALTCSFIFLTAIFAGGYF